MDFPHSNVLKDYFEDFSLWNKLHFYSFIYRRVYPNMFFYFFSINGKVREDDLSKSEVNKILELQKKYGKKLNGMWGFISTILKNRNGLSTYLSFSKLDYISEISVPLFQDVKEFFDKDINVIKKKG